MGIPLRFVSKFLIGLGLCGIAALYCSDARADTFVFEKTLEVAEAEAEPPEMKDGKPLGPRRIKEDAKLVWKQPKLSKLTVRTGPLVLSVESDGETSIFDFAKRRVYQLDEKSHTYADVSLFALIAFKVAELGNRFVLGKITSSVFKDKSGPKI